MYGIIIIISNLAWQYDVVPDSDVDNVLWSYHKLWGRMNRQVVPRSILGAKDFEFSLISYFDFIDLSSQFLHLGKTLSL